MGSVPCKAVRKPEQLLTVGKIFHAFTSFQLRGLTVLTVRRRIDAGISFHLKGLTVHIFEHLFHLFVHPVPFLIQELHHVSICFVWFYSHLLNIRCLGCFTKTEEGFPSHHLIDLLEQLCDLRAFLVLVLTQDMISVPTFLY